jgi:hypothetical protein
MDLTIIVFLHILFINSLFIAIDYSVLKYFVKTNVSFPLIAVAGLTSLFVGVYLTNHIVEYYFIDQWFGFSIGIVKKHTFLIGALILTFCNIVIELPFYILASKNRKVGASLKSAVISNFATNIPVGLFYLVTEIYYSHTE